MEFNYRFLGSSAISHSANQSELSFAPDTLREPTYFVAELAQHLPFREAISALNAVVVADLRFQPKDRTEYLAWLKQHEQRLLADYLVEQQVVDRRLDEVRAELADVRKQQSQVMAPYYKAQNTYFKWLYKHDFDAWFVLDPVITVHPDQVMFECFSQDESAYGCLSCNYEVFKNITDQAYGTTNIDYSAGLYNEFQKIRDYRKTELRIEPAGFSVATSGSEQFKEEKIDLPDSWVRGFLQVSSAMTLPMVEAVLHPMDIHNLLFHLKRKKERHGPRSLRFQLLPGKPVKVIIEPWEQSITFHRSIFQGTEEREIRIWGRRRLLMLERLLPYAKQFKMCLLGTGMPSFFIADLGDLRFTLGLSGWSSNDWSRMGEFNLMTSREEVDADTQATVFKQLQKSWSASTDQLAVSLKLERSIIISALSAYSQAGRVVYDLASDVYRCRELSREPLPIDALRFASPQEEKAQRLLTAGLVKLKHQTPYADGIKLVGQVRDDGKKLSVELIIDSDRRLTQASCECSHFIRNRLYKGPCEHMLALRLRAEADI
ncbi:SWIM zinc finger family protein [Spartinivicinus poritis]|uniref:SWIM zinc finger domain-containing protein n=1 Tax=Spartinivicinus poritis TaxID=2994640 RepID=A0ABT5UBH7_9GAMM|nr:SWIM zinc finger family protein [Spartinivicinus sp. A2-2]MDE1463733.1 SWIM zinc finger domain-containing protein [Spartinivicinus sp. A2-2]